MICSVEDCDKPFLAHSLCGMHYMRLRRHGHLDVTREQHRMFGTPEYKSWSGMKDRCKRDTYCSQKGIKVCDRWSKSFMAFYEDMGKKPDELSSIDRINPMGDYEPSNCRWANPTTQARNRTLFKNNTSGYKGVSWHKRNKVWAANICKSGKLIHLGNYNDILEAAKARNDAEKVLWEKSC